MILKQLTIQVVVMEDSVRDLLEVLDFLLLMTLEIME